MKKFLLMCCLLVGITAVSRAQGGGMRMSPDERSKQMQTQLKLTDDQTAKVKAIYEAQATKRDSIRTAANGDRDAMMAAMRPLQQATQDKVMALLNDDQKVAYKKMQDEMRARMQNGGGPPPPPNQ